MVREKSDSESDTSFTTNSGTSSGPPSGISNTKKLVGRAMVVAVDREFIPIQCPIRPQIQKPESGPILAIQTANPAFQTLKINRKKAPAVVGLV